MKKILMAVCLMVLVLISSSCGGRKPPNESSIMEDLAKDGYTTSSIENPFTESYDYYENEIKSLEIEKRQTNSKDDTVFCVVSLENEHYRIKKNLTLYYNYYDQGGWMLDDCDETSATWEVISSPFTDQNIEQLYAMTSYSYSYVGDPSVEENLDEGVLTYTFPVEESHKYGVYKGDYIYRLWFNGYSWEFSEDNSVKFLWDIDGYEWRIHDVLSGGIFYGDRVSDVSISVTRIDNSMQILYGIMSIIIDDNFSSSKNFDFSTSLPDSDVSTTFYSNTIELFYRTYFSTGPEAFKIVFTPDNVQLKSLLIGDSDFELVR